MWNFLLGVDKAFPFKSFLDRNLAKMGGHDFGRSLQQRHHKLLSSLGSVNLPPADAGISDHLGQREGSVYASCLFVIGLNSKARHQAYAHGNSIAPRRVSTAWQDFYAHVRLGESEGHTQVLDCWCEPEKRGPVANHHLRTAHDGLCEAVTVFLQQPWQKQTESQWLPPKAMGPSSLSPE